MVQEGSRLSPGNNPAYSATYTQPKLYP